MNVRFLVIVLTATVVTVLLHQIEHDPLMTLGVKPQSIFLTSGWFPLAASVGLAAAFAIIGRVFLAIENTLPGTGLRKGTRFGLALGGMYLVGMMEGYVVYPVSLLGEVYTGLVDGSGVLLVSLLLGRYVAEDAPGGERLAHAALSEILIFAAVFVLVRYVSYAVLHIESSYATRPVATFLWTAGMGCWVGVMYGLVGRHLGRGSRVAHALAFGGLVFGLSWILFNLFALIFIQVPVFDLLGRSVMDAAAAVGGAYMVARRVA